MTVSKQFLSGLFFVIVGGGAASIALNYHLGTATRMGPGYFPFIIGVMLAVVGALVVAHAVMTPAATDPLQSVAVRPLVIVVAAIVAFAVLLRPLGFFVALAAMIAIGWTADRERRWLELPAMIVVLAVISWGIFIYALQIPFKLWPW